VIASSRIVWGRVGSSITNVVRGGLLIKIRYSDLQPGLHASAETEGKHTVLYLVPGLSPTDRQSAIDRLRASAKVGRGPKLPAIPLALALMADRISVNSRNAAAAARLHPTGLAIPAVVLAGAGVLYALLVTVSIHMGMPATSALALEPLPVTSAPASPGPSPSHQAAAAATGDDSAGPARSSRLPGSPMPVPAVPGGHGTAPGSTQPHQPTPSPGQPTVSSSPQPSPSQTGPWTMSPSPAPSPTKTKGGGGGGGHCLNLGLVHVCL
jgi:hypothetical protein